MNMYTKTGVAICGLLATIAQASVTDIFAGETVALSGVSVAEDPTVGGTVIEDYAQDFVISDVTGAELYRGVLQSRITMRFDTGELDFRWRVRDVLDLPGQISSVAVNGYAGWEVGVEYKSDSLGDVGPSDALRTADDDTIGYLFSGLLTPTDESKFFFARTHAFEYGLTGTARINLISGEFVELATWAPAVPAPGSMGMLGLGGLVAMRRRR
tara:strand:+ start:435 stop:1073 length:639 start_codon:yes stop_codon:yes gene_type:complete